MKAAGSVVLSISLLGFVLLVSCRHTPVPFDEENWRWQVQGQSIEKLYAPHFNDGHYFNPWMPMEHGGFMRLLKWKLSSKAVYAEEEKNHRPGFIPDLKRRIEELPEGDFIVWIGHSTFLLRLQGDYWITDPMFSDRALLPRRIVPPALTGEELRALTPRLKVLISHNHYDHLD